MRTVAFYEREKVSNVVTSLVLSQSEFGDEVIFLHQTKTAHIPECPSFIPVELPISHKLSITITMKAVLSFTR